MMRQGTKYIFQELSNQDDTVAVAKRFDQLFGGLAAQLRFQNVLKVLFAEEIQAVAADSAEQSVQEARCKRAAREVGERPRQRHGCHARAARPALGKTLRVPSEESDRAHGAELEQGAFRAP